MRRFLCVLIIIAAVGIASASEKSERDGLLAAAWVLQLVDTCHLLDPRLPPAETARPEALAFLFAGGYSEAEADRIATALITEFERVRKPYGNFTLDECKARLKQLRDNAAQALFGILGSQ